MEKRAVGDLRRAQGLSNDTIRQVLGVSRGRVSQIEAGLGVSVMALREYVEVLGGDIVVLAVFPNGETYELTRPTGEPL